MCEKSDTSDFIFSEFWALVIPKIIPSDKFIPNHLTSLQFDISPPRSPFEMGILVLDRKFSLSCEGYILSTEKMFKETSHM